MLLLVVVAVHDGLRDVIGIHCSIVCLSLQSSAVLLSPFVCSQINDDDDDDDDNTGVYRHGATGR